MHNPDIVASRVFQKNKTMLFDGYDASFFIERTKEGIIMEIDTTNEFGENSMRIPLTKSALKELAVMFEAACKEEFPNDDKGLDNYK
jgi:hypothetical protein